MMMLHMEAYRINGYLHFLLYNANNTRLLRIRADRYTRSVERKFEKKDVLNP